jgi:ubiquitin C-terminal hydrolase
MGVCDSTYVTKNKTIKSNKYIEQKGNKRNNKYNRNYDKKYKNYYGGKKFDYKEDESSSTTTSYKVILIGLENIGATCYMNATIQCLSNTKELSRYFLTKFQYIQYDNDRIISNEYYKLLKHLWDEKNIRNKPYAPYGFKNIISQEDSLFEGIKANDSRDLINFLLERMHQELNIVKYNNNNITDINISNNPYYQIDKKTVFQIFINNYTKNYNSIISDLFYGVNEIKTECLGCNKIKYNYELFYFLEFHLEQVNIIKQNNKNKNIKDHDIDIYDFFEYYRRNELMKGENNMYCNICKISCDAYYSTELYSMPNYLIIVLNRGKGNIFQYDLQFPKILDLKKYVKHPESGYMYDLYGVICHLGPSSMGGHFIAFCRHRMNNLWYKYNDSKVTECEDDEILYGVPYILFYQKIIIN